MTNSKSAQTAKEDECNMCENTISVNTNMAGCYRLQRWAVATAIRCGARAQGGANPTAHLQRTTLANVGALGPTVNLDVLHHV